MKRTLLATLSIALAACAPEPEPETTRAWVAPLANDGCGDAPTPGLPDRIDRLVAQFEVTPGLWETRARFDRGDGLSSGEVLFEDVPAGEAQRLRLIGCAGATATLVAHPDPIAVGDDEKHLIDLQFRPISALSCTGTPFGDAYNRYAALGRARVWPAVAPLPDGRWWVGGGADSIDSTSDTLRSSDAEGWDVFVPGLALFLPGADSAKPLIGRALNAPRVAAQAAPYTAPDGTTGVLVVGGAAEVEWGDSPFGPLLADAPAQPAAEFFDPTSGAMVPIEGIGPRFLAAVAADSSGRVVIAGGIDDKGEAIDEVLVLVGGKLHTFPIGTGIVGATLTPLNTTQFLAWGGDVGGCGERPGWLVQTDPPSVSPLALQAPEAAPTCAAPQDGCRTTWYATAYHAAARLPGPNRVLITGGIKVVGNRVLNNPDLGPNCEPNAFVVTVDPDSGTASISAAPAPADGTRLKRALHQMVSSRNTVYLTGGWRTFRSGGTVLSTALVAAEGFFSYEDFTATWTDLEAPNSDRLGVMLAPTPSGGVVWAGGLSAAAPDDRAPTSIAAIWEPGLETPDTCP